MSLLLRLLLGYSLVLGLAFTLFVQGTVKEIKPGVRQATEQTLVNTAHLLAELVAAELAAGQIESGAFLHAIEAFDQRHFGASIWDLDYDQPDLRIHITDHAGIVRFDSRGEDLGKDFSRWNDIYLTLRGGYGARSTRADPADETSSVMHVAAPILHRGALIGVLSVSRPNLSLQPYIDGAQARVRWLGAGLLLSALALALAISFWLTGSIRRLTRFADALSAGKRVQPPALAEAELAQLGQAMSEMRDELDGKAHVEDYVLTLTHEIKSPLTAINAAVEILEGDPDVATRRRFLGHIASESSRLQQLVERLLGLASLEKRQQLETVEPVALQPMLEALLQAKSARLIERRIGAEQHEEEAISVEAEPFLLQQALSNLLDNAIDFSPEGGQIRCGASRQDDEVCLWVEDQGPGVPDYALARVTERFYSLPRPQGGSKSTGLGLAFVQEVAELHGGRFSLFNGHPGARAELHLPARQAAG